MTREAVRPLCLYTLGLSAAAFLGACGGAAVKQDANSGDDATIDGARTIKLNEFGEGRSEDTVSYPGGDRVDWKVIEIDKKGDLEITLKWNAPKPDLDLAMNVLDDTFNMAKRVPPGGGDGQRKVAKLNDISPGLYYIQVYASERKDAGDYTLDIKFSPSRAGEIDTAHLAPIPNPPRLPGVPAAVAAAAGGGGDSSKPKGDKANPCTVGEQCPPGSAFKRPACPDAEPAPLEVPCPTINPACPEAGLLAAGMPCPPKVIPPRLARIIERSLSGGDVIITLDKGSNQGIAKGWTGVVFQGKSGTKLLPKGDFKIFKVTEDESYGKVGVTLDDLSKSSRVELRAPAEAP